jgi:hypothetical protein
VRGAVLLADVRLELDDPADPGATGGVGADESRAEQGARGLEGGSGEELPIDDRGRAAGSRDQPPLPEKLLRSAFGMSGPVIAKKAGTSVFRKISAVSDPS